MSLATNNLPRNGFADEMLRRFKTEWINQPHTRAFHPVLEGVLDLAASTQAIRREIESTGKFSPVGVVDATRAGIATKILPDMQKLVDRFDGFMDATKGKRASISPKPVDRADAYALAIRQEVRQHLKTLDRPGLAKVLLSDPDDIIVEAVMEVPAALVSPHLDADISGKMLRTWVERRYPDKLREVEEQEEAGKLVEGALAHAVNVVRKEAGFENAPRAHFDLWMTEVAGGPKKKT